MLSILFSANNASRLALLGAVLTFLVTLFLLKKEFAFLPRDHGRAFAVDGEKSKGKLRGVESFGMMCSIEELGSNRDMFPEAPEDGIYIFPEDVKVGEDAIKLFGLDDVVVEYEITSNRVDCFSVLGIAREAAATFGKEFIPPEVKETGNSEDVNSIISGRVCKRAVKAGIFCIGCEEYHP